MYTFTGCVGVGVGEGEHILSTVWTLACVSLTHAHALSLFIDSFLMIWDI